MLSITQSHFGSSYVCMKKKQIIILCQLSHGRVWKKGVTPVEFTNLTHIVLLYTFIPVTCNTVLIIFLRVTFAHRHMRRPTFTQASQESLTLGV